MCVFGAVCTCEAHNLFAQTGPLRRISKFGQQKGSSVFSKGVCTEGSSVCRVGDCTLSARDNKKTKGLEEYRRPRAIIHVRSRFSTGWLLSSREEKRRVERQGELGRRRRGRPSKPPLSIGRDERQRR